MGPAHEAGPAHGPAKYHHRRGRHDYPDHCQRLQRSLHRRVHRHQQALRRPGGGRHLLRLRHDHLRRAEPGGREAGAALSGDALRSGHRPGHLGGYLRRHAGGRAVGPLLVHSHRDRPERGGPGGGPPVSLPDVGLPAGAVCTAPHPQLHPGAWQHPAAHGIGHIGVHHAHRRGPAAAGGAGGNGGHVRRGPGLAGRRPDSCSQLFLCHEQGPAPPDAGERSGTIMTEKVRLERRDHLPVLLK